MLPTGRASIVALLAFVMALVIGAPSALAQSKRGAPANHDPHPVAPPAPPPEGERQSEPEAPPVPHGPVTYHVGIALEKLTKFELGPGSYSAEFFVSLRCDVEPCKPDFDVANGKITGREKLTDEKLHHEFRVKAELEALVDLSEFPFDKHVLYIGLVDKGDPLNVRYVVDENETSIDPKVKLAGWNVEPLFATHVEDHKLDDQHTVHELQFGVAIGRPAVAAVFKTLVPVFFMFFVAGFTLLLKPKSAAGRLSAATGGLMTVVMFHLSATSSLPPLGYLTRMDKFMIATYLVYLVNIAFAVAMVRLDEKKDERAAELTYLVAGGAVPGLALLAWLTVFLKIA